MCLFPCIRRWTESMSPWQKRISVAWISECNQLPYALKLECNQSLIIGRTHEAVGGFNLVTLLQILPILILFLVTYLPYSEPHYSLQKAHPYQFRKVTKDFGVPYYVRSVDFDKELQPGSPQQADLELQIIRDYKGYLGSYCHKGRRGIRLPI